MTAYAAKKLGRPVRWRSERGEDFLAAIQARDHLSHAELALDRDGRILALRADTLANGGACCALVSMVIPLVLSQKVITGTYHVPLVDLRSRVVLTNTMTIGPYRGAGRPEGVYLIERLMDAAAAQLGLDPAEMRRRNFAPPEAMPYKTATGEVFDSGEFARLLDRALEASDRHGFAKRRAAAEARGKRLGRGLCSYVEWTGGNQLTEVVGVTVHGDGRVVVHSATQAMGQGLETTYVGLVAERLGIDPASITIVQGDTDLVAGFGSAGSRSAFVGGSAVAAGTDELVKTATGLAAEALEAAAPDIEFRDGSFIIAGTDRAIGLTELAGRQKEQRIAVRTTHSVDAPSWPNGFHVCEIEIDPETGAAEITRYTTVDDVGHALNRMLVEGQIHGGVAQGVGQALCEQAVYDRGSGQLLTGSFMDYAMPRADQFPPISVNIDEGTPCRTNILGAKGCGESGTVGAVPTVVAAILDALRPLGVTDIDMPATPQAIWNAIRKAKGG